MLRIFASSSIVSLESWTKSERSSLVGKWVKVESISGTRAVCHPKILFRKKTEPNMKMLSIEPDWGQNECFYNHRLKSERSSLVGKWVKVESISGTRAVCHPKILFRKKTEPNMKMLSIEPDWGQNECFYNHSLLEIELYNHKFVNISWDEKD